jgi:carbonic anhydrase
VAHPPDPSAARTDDASAASTDPRTVLDEVLAAAAPPGSDERPDSPRPTRRVAVLTCMDARIAVLADLRLAFGDAHVIRVAGARVGDDVVRSLHLSTAVLGVRGVLVLGHTDCGLHDRDGTLAEQLAELDPERSDWGVFTDPETAVRDDVATLLAWPERPPGFAVAGAVIDVHDGAVRVVVPPTAA